MANNIRAVSPSLFSRSLLFVATSLWHGQASNGVQGRRPRSWIVLLVVVAALLRNDQIGASVAINARLFAAKAHSFCEFRGTGTAPDATFIRLDAAA